MNPISDDADELIQIMVSGPHLTPDNNNVIYNDDITVTEDRKLINFIKPDGHGTILPSLNLGTDMLSYLRKNNIAGYIDLDGYSMFKFYIDYKSSVINNTNKVDITILSDAINFLLVQDGTAVLRYST